MGPDSPLEGALMKGTYEGKPTPMDASSLRPPPTPDVTPLRCGQRLLICSRTEDGFICTGRLIRGAFEKLRRFIN